MEGESFRGGPPRFEKLDEDYRTWSAYCRAYLKNRGVWDAVVTPRPVDAPVGEAAAGAAAEAAAAAADTDTGRAATKAVAAWDRKNEVALSDIMMAIKPHLLNIVEDCTTAAEAWYNLQVLFEDDTTSRRAELEQELAVLKMHGGETIIKYIGRGKGLRNSLATAGVAVDEHSLVLHILRGLPPGYGMIKTVLENLPGALKLPSATAKLLTVEKQLKAGGDDAAPPGGQAFTAGANPVTPTPKGKKKAKCFYCKRYGHFIRDCRSRKAADARKDAGDGGGPSDRMGFMARIRNDGAPADVGASTPDVWLVDSGATHHMATGRGTFEASEEEAGPGITLASGGTAAVTGRGTALLNATKGNRTTVVTLSDALRVPELKENLLSVAMVDKAGGAALFMGGKCYLFQKADVVRKAGILNSAGATGELDMRGQYMMGGAGGAPPKANVASAAKTGVPVVWHRRFFHLGYDNLAKAAKIVDGLPASEVIPERVAGAVCPPCVAGKMAKAPYKPSTSVVGRLELLVSDTCGPFQASLGGAKHFVTLMDKKTGLLVAVPIKAKSDVGVVIRSKVPMLERLCGDKARRIRFDGAKEYITATQRQWYSDAGIDIETTPPYSSQSNGVAERANRTIKDRARAALADAGLGPKMWAEAVVAAVYVMNRSPRAGQDKTPWEAFTGKRPDVAGLRVWGSKAYALLPAKQQKGMAPKTTVGTMVGYAVGGNGYRVYVPTTKEVVVRRDVVMDESGIGSQGPAPQWLDGGEDPPVAAPRGDAGGPPTPTPGVSPVLTPSPSGTSTGSSSGTTGPTGTAAGQWPAAPIEDAVEAARRIALPASDEESGSDDDEQVRRYPLRERAPPRPWHGGASVAAAGQEPKVHRDQLPPPPKDAEEARQRPDWPQWKEAIEKEEASMMDNNVWTKSKLPRGRKALKTKLVFDYKYKQTGALDRYKVRLVALGCRQQPGRDYNETWAPVPAAPVTRALLATAAAHGLHAHHVDVKTAYLNAPMDMEVYITIPTGFNDEGKAGRVNKAIYGTKQAGRLWAIVFHNAVVKWGGVQSKADPCVYTLLVDGVKVTVEVHVDDILIVAAVLEAISKVKNMVAEAFQVRDLGEVCDYLGMDIKWDRVAGTVTLANPRHTAAVLEDFSMTDCKPNAHPMAPGAVLGEGKPLERGNRYAELVGSLLFLANQTRPDIAFAVGRLARRMAIPTEGDMTAAKGVLRYLQGTKSMGLAYGPAQRLTGWVDSDFAGHTKTRKSTTGFLFTLHGGAISWRSRLQSIVTASTAEAEYVAASEAVKDSLWLRRVADALGENGGPVTIGEDNQACLAMAANPMSSCKTKHVDIRYHLVRDYVRRGEVALEYVPTEDMAADGFTKALTGEAFTKFRVALGVREVGRAEV